MQGQDFVVSLDNVSAGYDGVEVIRNATFKVMPEDFIGIIGPNGGGKTTLIKTILHLVPVLSGQVSYKRRDIKIGYLPQMTTLDKNFPVCAADVVCSGNASERPDYDKARKLLERFGVEFLFRKQISLMSGGELQRVLLARAMISNPELLILDEPSTYVDGKFERKMYDILHDINRSVPIIMVSHDLGMISKNVRSIVCVNRSVHYHPSNQISQHQLDLYDCPIQLLDHGRIPHTILQMHE